MIVSAPLHVPHSGFLIICDASQEALRIKNGPGSLLAAFQVADSLKKGKLDKCVERPVGFQTPLFVPYERRTRG